jgi:hypothetical protein
MIPHYASGLPKPGDGPHYAVERLAELLGPGRAIEALADAIRARLEHDAGVNEGQFEALDRELAALIEWGRGLDR